MVTRRVTASLAVLLLLAGCSAAGGPAGDLTVTPAPVPTDSSPTPAHRVAPGLAEAGVVGPLALVDTHAEILEGSTFQVHIEEHIEPVGGGPVVFRVMTGTVANRTSYSLRFVRGVENQIEYDRRLYADTEALYERLVVAIGPRYYVPRERLSERSAYPVDPLGRIDQREELYIALVSTRPDYAGQDSVDGIDVHRIIATEVRDQVLLARWKYVDSVRDVEFEAVVTDDGLVRSYQFSYVASNGGDGMRVTRTARWTVIESGAVPEPDWYKTARNQTGA